MTPTKSSTQTQIDNLKLNFVDQLTSLLRKVTSEVVSQVLSENPVKVESDRDGRFSARLPDGRVISRSRKRDLTRFLRNEGYSYL